MSTPRSPQGPNGPNPYQPGPQPSQPAGGQETYAPGDDIPHQQGPRDGQYATPGQGYQVPGQGAGDADGQRGTYNAYPPAGGYVSAGASPPSYLEGASVGFGEAIRGAASNIFTYRGRASRSAFWWFALFQIIAYLVVGLVSGVSRPVGIALDIVVGLPLIFAGISLAVRRLHDSGRSGWWWWIGFVPLAGGIVLLVFYLLPGTPGSNRYNLSR
jgi:uncharacterized membrane protein YhaH (DUF805 family)